MKQANEKNGTDPKVVPQLCGPCASREGARCAHCGALIVPTAAEEALGPATEVLEEQQKLEDIQAELNVAEAKYAKARRERGSHSFYTDPDKFPEPRAPVSLTDPLTSAKQNWESLRRAHDEQRHVVQAAEARRADLERAWRGSHNADGTPATILARAGGLVGWR